MKVAVLSDIHGNLPALKAVVADIDRWQPEYVVVAGDIVNRGPSSDECLKFVLQRRDERGWHLLRGNHEDFVLECADPDRPRSGPAYEMTRFAHFALAQINGQVDELTALPDMYEISAPDGQVLRVVHASMRSNREGIYPMTSDEQLRQLIEPAPAVFVTGHTHRALVRQIDDAIVVNIGSVGSSFDGDQRAAYGRFRWTGGCWETEVVRVEYDYASTEADYVSSGFLEHGGPLAQLILVEFRKARGLIFRWADRYEGKIISGDISVEQSIRELLSEADLLPYTGPPGWVV